MGCFLPHCPWILQMHCFRTRMFHTASLMCVSKSILPWLLLGMPFLYSYPRRSSISHVLAALLGPKPGSAAELAPLSSRCDPFDFQCIALWGELRLLRWNSNPKPLAPPCQPGCFSQSTSCKGNQETKGSWPVDPFGWGLDDPWAQLQFS